MKNLYAVVLIFLIGSSSVNVYAQSKVTFNINLKPQLEDSTFIPGRDLVQLVGSIRPINTARPTYLVDSEPVDSIYSVTVDFSSRYRNQTLTYNFELRVNFERRKETLPRTLLLSLREIELDPLYFDAFAW